VQPWSDERVWDAIDAWRWVPPGSTKIETERFTIVLTPGSWTLTFVYGFRVPDPAEADAGLAEVRQRIEAGGGTGAKFQLTPRCAPADLDARLIRRGYHLENTTDVLVWELRDRADAPRFPDVPAAPVTVRPVVTEDDYVAAGQLVAPIFHEPPLPEATRARLLEDFRQTVREGKPPVRYLAWLDGTPVGCGGLSVVDGVGQFWGTGVLPEYRRRGIYGALVRARCEAALAQGAEVGLVTAVIGTSGPILRKLGFRPVGQVQRYVVDWSAGGAPG
jgi:GNAT superfamily N-acetyltransferase